MDDKEKLYILLKELFLVLDLGDKQLFGRYDLTVPRYYTLYHLANSPGLSLSQLSDLLLCDKSNVSRIFRGLEQKGLVCRRNHETDKRVFRAYLTDAGTAVYTQVSKAHQQYTKHRLSDFKNQRQANVLNSLTTLKQQLLDSSFQDP